jgi:hypothetical protein
MFTLSASQPHSSPSDRTYSFLNRETINISYLAELTRRQPAAAKAVTGHRTPNAYQFFAVASAFVEFFFGPPLFVRKGK